jgi:hypothetical protein
MSWPPALIACGQVTALPSARYTIYASGPRLPNRVSYIQMDSLRFPIAGHMRDFQCSVFSVQWRGMVLVYRPR